jgi:secreted Zn-dependent insulinase-like peptidase
MKQTPNNDVSIYQLCKENVEHRLVDSSHQRNVLVEELCNPNQGDADWRQYRCVRLLNNGVTICCVNDLTSKTTAVAATVNVGAAHDPRAVSGLARTLLW